jgi:hypothetical protein
MIGWLLNNDVSRNILKLLFEQNMTANEIAKKSKKIKGSEAGVGGFHPTH